MSASERKIAELEDELRKVRHLLTQQMRAGRELEFEGIVNSDGEPFVHLRWDELSAQIEPEQAREMALSLLRVSEWAELDATVFRAIRDEMDLDAAAGLLAILREARGGHRDQAAKA